MNKYVIINYEDLTDESKKHLESLPLCGTIKKMELKPDRTGYIVNQRPI